MEMGVQFLSNLYKSPTTQIDLHQIRKKEKFPPNLIPLGNG